MYCWGMNDVHQCGISGFNTVESPTKVSANLTIFSFTVGYDFACFTPVQPGGEAAAENTRCWGSNNWGQTGTGTRASVSVPTAISGSTAGSDFFAKLSAGRYHACTVRQSGTARCWGRNQAGELAQDPVSAPYLTTPHDVPAPGEYAANMYKDVTCGESFTCTLIATGEVYCFGDNSKGALGNGTGTNSFVPVQAGMTHGNIVTAISGRGTTMYVATYETALYAWGDNSEGQLGSSSYIDVVRLLPLLIADSGISSLFSSSGYACAMGNSALVPNSNAVCWGSNSSGQLGLGNKTSTPSPLPLVPGRELQWATLGLGVQSAYGYQVAKISPPPEPAAPEAPSPLGLGLVAWGDNSRRQLGTAGFDPAFVAEPVSISLNLNLSPTVGGTFACAISDASTKELYCWGGNNIGQLGQGNVSQDVPSPIRVLPPEGTKVEMVAAGYNYACLISEGYVAAACWGENLYGQLGNGTKAIALSPTTVDGLAATAIATGHTHTCAISTSGRLFCWGSNSAGELGQNDSEDRTTPVQVGVATWTRVTCGSSTTCGIDDTTQAWCWGSNVNGEAGINEANMAFVRVPTQVVGGSEYVSISTWGGTTCGIKDRTVYCWGVGASGQMGDGNYSDPSFAPVEATTMGFATIVVSGGNHVCAVTSNFRFYCWGSNSRGACGVGSDDASFAEAQRLSGRASSIAARNDNSLAILAMSPDRK